MKTKRVQNIPICDGCKRQFDYINDVPTIHGVWSYLCDTCVVGQKVDITDYVGFRLERYIKDGLHIPMSKTLDGIELSTLEEMFNTDVRVIGCPTCHKEHIFVLDAIGETLCVCGQVFKIKDIECLSLSGGI